MPLTSPAVSCWALQWHFQAISAVIFCYNSCHHHPWPKPTTALKDLLADHKSKLCDRLCKSILKIGFAGWGPALQYLPDTPIYRPASMEEWIYTFHAQLLPSAPITLFLSSQRILRYLHSLALVSKQENYNYYYFLNRDIWKLLLKPYFLLFKTYYNSETARNTLKLK